MGGVLCQFGTEEEHRVKSPQSQAPDTHWRCDSRLSGLPLAQLCNGDSNSSCACSAGWLWKSDEVMGIEVP